VCGNKLKRPTTAFLELERSKEKIEREKKVSFWARCEHGDNFFPASTLLHSIIRDNCELLMIKLNRLNCLHFVPSMRSSSSSAAAPIHLLSRAQQFFFFYNISQFFLALIAANERISE
jgi:hypothetical protein